MHSIKSVHLSNYSTKVCFIHVSVLRTILFIYLLVVSRICLTRVTLKSFLLIFFIYTFDTFIIIFNLCRYSRFYFYYYFYSYYQTSVSLPLPFHSSPTFPSKVESATRPSPNVLVSVKSFLSTKNPSSTYRN